MSSHQIVSRNQLCFENFRDTEKQFRKVLALIKKARLYEALNTSTIVYSKLVREFYLNGVYGDGILSTKVKGIVLQLNVMEINHLLGFIPNSITTLNCIDVEVGLEQMGYKKNLELKGMK